MTKVFISNAKLRDSGDIIIDDSFVISDFSLNEESKSGEHVFVIDVHCTFSGAEKMQQQGGVVIYRHLLKLFKDCQDKLKVIFYSPLPVVQLVALKPENYILHLMPFVELCPVDVNGCYREDWDFEAALQANIEENRYPQFNNASENLLSGWASAGASKINLKGKKLLVIDDEWRQWEIAYREIFQGSVDYFLKGAADIKAEFEKLNDGTFAHLPEGSLAQYDVIISDLYLNEAHETNTWKTEDVINSISGFKLFKKIRRIEPAIPMLFHTTSTKFRIFETLSALGADGQIAKNINPNPSNNEKVETALLLKQSLESFLRAYSDCWLNSFYRFLSNDRAVLNTWWVKIKNVAKDPSIKKEVVDVVRSMVLSSKIIKRIKPEYFDIFFPNAEVKPISLIVSGIISNAGKLFEAHLLGAGYNPELQFTYQLRNHSAHGKDYHNFNFDDVLIVIGLLEKTLREEKPRVIGGGEKFKTPFKNTHRYTHPLFEYVHYYNNWGFYIPDGLAEKFKARIGSLLDDYHVSSWKTYSIDVKESIIAEMDYMEFGNKVKPVFSNGTCRILLTNDA